MARKAHLRDATDEAPAPKPKTVSEAAKSGTHLELLATMRDRVALAVQSEQTSPRDLAALTKRLGDLAAEIRAERARMTEEGGEDGAAPGDEAFSEEAI